MKSHNQSYLFELFVQIYIDCMNRLSTDIDSLDAKRDIAEVHKRVEQEGVSFLTLTLPKYFDDVLISLELGFIPASCFRSFKKHGQIPAFLQGIIGRLFDFRTGGFCDAQLARCHDGTYPLYLEVLRQLCVSFKKIELPCTPERVLQARLEYIAVERELEDFRLPDDRIFKAVSRVIWSDVFDGRFIFDCHRTRPKHGPGAVVENLTNNRKWIFATWNERLEPVFPYTAMAHVNENYIDDPDVGLDKITFIPEDQEPPVKVITVPKTLKTPRIIGIEQHCMQYCQQSLSSMLIEYIEKSRLTGGHINFDDQTINQRLAIEASRTGDKATIDLSAASDRVPWSGIQAMLDIHTDLILAISSCRAKRAQIDINDHNVLIHLLKFASMGSALTFVLESMYFYTICVSALVNAKKTPPTSADIRHAASQVWVYGDDLIVPTDQVDIVMDYLQKYNCKVNTTKSFWKSKFRESCGADAYDGVVITPIYIRQPQPTSRDEANRIISWTKTAQQLTQKGMFNAAEYMYGKVEETLMSTLPTVGPRCSGLGRLHSKEIRQSSGKFRYNKDLHRLEKLAYVPSPVLREDCIDGHAALLKCLTGNSNSPSSLTEGSLCKRPSLTFIGPISQFDIGVLSRSVSTLETSSLPYAVSLKRRWVASDL